MQYLHVLPGPDISCIYRFRRFVEAIEGFHKGSLGLTGRHSQRYWSLFHRFLKLTEDLAVTVLQRHYREFPKEDLVLHNVRVLPQWPEWEVEPATVLENFCKTWRMDAPNPPEMFKSCIERGPLLRDHPQPIFQKLIFLDLPPELIFSRLNCKVEHSKDKDKLCYNCTLATRIDGLEEHKLYCPPCSFVRSHVV